MAITLTGTTKTTSTVTASITIPAGTQVGDVMLIFAYAFNAGFATPSGWSNQPGLGTNGSYTLAFGAMYGWYRVATVGDTGGSTVVTITGGATDATAMFVSYSGVKTSAPFNVNSKTTSTSTTSYTDPGVTTTVANCQTVEGIIGLQQAVNQAVTFPVTNQVNYNQIGLTAGGISDQAQAIAGPSGGHTVNTSTQPYIWSFITVGLAPSIPVPTLRVNPPSFPVVI